MSVVGEITLLCGWECLLEPVVAWTSAHCFCLIKVLIWPSSDLCVFPGCCLKFFLFFVYFSSVATKPEGPNLMVCVFGLFIPPPAARLNQAGHGTGADEQEGKMSHFEPEDISLTASCARSLTAGGKRGGGDSAIPGLTRRASKQMERCLGFDI